jgi:hypothetical protein
MRARVALALALCIAPPSLGGQSVGIAKDSLDTLRRISTFAFRARVDSLNASAIAGIHGSAHTIVVTPSKALQCPAAVGLYTLMPVTVYLDDPTGVAAGDSLWFFGSAWIIGRQIGVRAIARVRATLADTLLESIFLGDDGPRAQQFHHLQDTAIVVTGRVVLDRVRPAIGHRQGMQSLNGAISVPLVVSSRMLLGSVVRQDTTAVAIPITMALTNPLLQVPDANQHLLFILHPTLGQTANIISKGPRPLFMFRGDEDIWPIADSAGFQSLINALPSGNLGSRPADFVPQCGILQP